MHSSRRAQAIYSTISVRYALASRVQSNPPRMRALTLLFVVAASAGCGLLPGVDDAASAEAPVSPGQDLASAQCGQPGAPACGTGHGCSVPSECASGLCEEHKCLSANAKDGAKNGDETDVDCGGKGAPSCADGKACVAGSDCASGVCGAGVCQAPSPTDGVKNGAETDVDCGGPDAPKCVAGSKCAASSDCASGACSADHVCQVAPSCTGKLGAGAHCGPNGNESCCASARVPNVGDVVTYGVPAWDMTANVSAYRLDKYEITTGRLRAFFEAMDGDPRSHFESRVGAGAGAHPHVAGSGWQSSWNRRLPSSWAQIQSRYGDPDENIGGIQYCMRGQGGQWGTTTWRAEPDANPKLEENFEVKPMVCLDWYTLFAFCAWDGGRLPTTAEWGVAAGDDRGYTYPWGNSPVAYDKAVTALNGIEAAFPNFSWGADTRFPFDRGTHIAPPGRKAPGPHGHYDLAGNVGEWMLDAYVPRSRTCDDCADISGWKTPALDWPDYEPVTYAGHPSWKDGGYRVMRGGTWEGHEIKNVQGTWDGLEVGFTYHAIGGRCARDL